MPPCCSPTPAWSRSRTIFLGLQKPESPRAASSQKVMRVSGKHNDLENVGPSPRHHTFFEMLGNFSFGDYFKEDAIRFGWDLVTRVWGLAPAASSPPSTKQDDEAFDLWVKLSSLPPERVHRCGEKDNFWAMGDTGPCGPCSEIFVDLHPERPRGRLGRGDSDSGRYMEIWNLVFMQYDRDADEGADAAAQAVDRHRHGPRADHLGARRGCIRTTTPTSSSRSSPPPPSWRGRSMARDAEKDVSMRVIADHLRAVSFLLADGVIPGNEGRGYVLRRILRRAVRHGMRLGFEEPFLHKLVPVLGEVMGGAYLELAATRQASMATIKAEEEKFLSTVANGARQVQEEIERLVRRGSTTLPGADGLPPLRHLRPAAGGDSRDRRGGALPGRRAGVQRVAGGSARAVAQGDGRGAEPSLGAARGAARPRRSHRHPVRGIRADRDDRHAGRGGAPGHLARGGAGARLHPAEGAGGRRHPRSDGVLRRVGRRGGGYRRAALGRRPRRVVDTQKDQSGVFFHFVEVEEGSLARPHPDAAQGGSRPALAIQRNHTATHLLHAALRLVLGKSVRQAGSLVAPDRLRFDFTYHRGMFRQEWEQTEDLVNEWIRRSVQTEIRHGAAIRRRSPPAPWRCSARSTASGYAR